MNRQIPLNIAAFFSEDRINGSKVSSDSFVTTDSMLQDKNGIGTTPVLPKGSLIAYSEGDILVGNIRPYLKKIWYADRKGGCSPDVLVLKAKPGFDAKFLYYSLFRDDFFRHMMKGSKGTKMPRGDKSQIMRFHIPEIDFTDQQLIADVLSSLDAKINLNKRINAELEEMAKTLYDYWFVQFDFPTSAEYAASVGKPDKSGKPYKASGGKMVWNEELKREIPEGWEVEGIEKSCSIIDCLHSKKSELVYEDECSYLLQLDNIKDDGLLDLSNKYYVTKAEYKRWTSRIEVQEDDILITNAGRVAATAQMPKNVIAGIGRNITAIRPNLINPTYLFLSFRGADIKRQIRLNTDSGAFFTSFNVKGIKKLQILRPKNKIEDKFEEMVRPIRQKRELNNSENQKLTELRDWLLPMLMNGQVKVK